MMFDDADPSTPTPRPTLSRDLSAIYHGSANMPAAVDHAVLNDARAHLARSARGRRVLRWSIGLGAVAAAAAVLLAVFVNRPERAARQLASVQEAPPAVGNNITGDINHDGHVDVLDAL